MVAAAAGEPEATLYTNVCAWCNERRQLPFDLRSSFVCEDAGLQCNPEAKKIGSEREAIFPQDESGDEELELHEHLCAWCGERRFLPMQLGPDFVCRDVGLECSENSAQRPQGKDSIVTNRCAFCGCERRLPFDFGEEFHCEDGGFDCDLSSSQAQANAAKLAEEIEREVAEEGEGDEMPELFCNFCTLCGAERELPYDLRDSGFVCGDVGIACLGEQEEQFENFCINCRKTKMAPFKLDDGFVCGECNDAARQGRPRYELAPPPPPPEESDSDGDLDAETKAKFKKINERTQLLWEVLIKELSMEAAAELFRKRGHETCTQEELMNLRTNTARNYGRDQAARRNMLKARLKNLHKKNSELRWRNGEQVTVSKKDKFVYTGGESAADKAKTSIELYILGIGRGGRHAVKIARDEKKKGPRSHK